MFTKISIVSIIKDHVLTLRSGRTGKVYFPDIILFFLFPLLFSGALIILEVPLNDGLVNTLITSFSIFSALLFNLLLLVYDISCKKTEENVLIDPFDIEEIIKRRRLLQEIYVNVSFAILISIVNILVLMSYFLKTNNCNLVSFNICSFQRLLAFIVYYISIQFILTLFMILKRVYLLLGKSFNSSN